MSYDRHHVQDDGSLVRSRDGDSGARLVAHLAGMQRAQEEGIGVALGHPEPIQIVLDKPWHHRLEQGIGMPQSADPVEY
ncbi:hypothetical protein, partial [Serratia marcescens]|uniref:hypothetical protein n=1 Tax=Serratia marcescens TaxID=615 RepID=UPI0013DB8F5A